MLGPERAATVSAVGGAVVEVARAVEGIHQALADRVFARLGSSSVLPAVAHRTATATIHAGIRGTTRAVDLVAAPLVAASARPGAVALHETTRGGVSLGILGSAFGDRLHGRTAALAPAMTLRHEGRPLAVRRAALKAAHPRASSTVVVFVHGLAGTEHAWGADDSFASRLADETGVSCLQVRYTSGRHISESGQDLDALLAELARAWPVTVDRLVLVGHSMGGLVLRSAIESGQGSGAAWVPLVSDVFHLGSPHRGAPLERWTAATARRLRRLPETAPLADLLDRRSAGVQDLRHGSLLTSDWDTAGPDGPDEADVGDVRLLPSARHHVVAATVTRDAPGTLAETIGDVLVPWSSATGQGPSARRTSMPAGSVRHVGRAHHLDLLRHPEVYALLSEALRPSCPGSR